MNIMIMRICLTTYTYNKYNLMMQVNVCNDIESYALV